MIGVGPLRAGPYFDSYAAAIGFDKRYLGSAE